jgi:hypothetical protein
MIAPYVHSNYTRIENDNYQTIDRRCIYGLLEHITPTGLCVDVCSPTGSGIVDTLLECGYQAYGEAYAFDNDIYAEWIVTNPPYTQPAVDNILKRQIRRIHDEEVYGVAALLRSNFDFAKSRESMFNSRYYAGEIKLRFRPWWSKERKAQPIHNYVWHIWHKDADGPPRKWYSSNNPIPPGNSPPVDISGQV